MTGVAERGVGTRSRSVDASKSFEKDFSLRFDGGWRTLWENVRKLTATKALRGRWFSIFP